MIACFILKLLLSFLLLILSLILVNIFSFFYFSFELQNKRKTESTTEKKEQNQDYIIKEAEMIINNYCNKIENNQKKEKILKSIQKKNKRMKKYLLI